MLDIYPQLLLFTAIVFLALLVFLNKTLYKPLLSFMEKRDEVIESDRLSATKNESDISSYEDEARAIILEAKSKVLQQKNDALEIAKKEVSMKIEDKKTQLDKEYALFQEKMQEQRKELKDSLLAQMPSFKSSMKTKLSQL